jgi:hypothetical protein
MKTLDLFGFAHERGINEMFYANFRYKYWPEKTKIRFIFEQNRKNETFRSQKNETLTSLVNNIAAERKPLAISLQ